MVLSIVLLPQVQGCSQRTIKSTMGCSISRTVVVLPIITVIQFDRETPVSHDKPPENIVIVSLNIQERNINKNSFSFPPLFPFHPYPVFEAFNSILLIVLHFSKAPSLLTLAKRRAQTTQFAQ